MRVWNVQIEEEKIDDMSIKKAIGKISHDASQQERQRDVAPKIWQSPPEEKSQNNEKRDRRNYDEERIVVPERTKRRAGIRDVDQVEEIRDHNARFVGTNEPQDQLFCPLIECVERERKKEDEPHIDVLSFGAQRNRVEESLTANLMGTVRIIGDVSTPLDMTGTN
jgi:hypothetical protein